MILDTSFLIDLFDGRRAAFEKGVELVERGVVQRVPSPVVTELSYGAALADENERRNVENALRAYRIVVQAETVADRAGRLLARVDATPDVTTTVGDVDSMIAAVADVYDEPVVTADAADFEALGVEVERY